MTIEEVITDALGASCAAGKISSLCAGRKELCDPVLGPGDELTFDVMKLGLETVEPEFIIVENEGSDGVFWFPVLPESYSEAAGRATVTATGLLAYGKIFGAITIPGAADRVRAFVEAFEARVGYSVEQKSFTEEKVEIVQGEFRLRRRGDLSLEKIEADGFDCNIETARISDSGLVGLDCKYSGIATVSYSGKIRDVPEFVRQIALTFMNFGPRPTEVRIGSHSYTMTQGVEHLYWRRYR